PETAWLTTNRQNKRNWDKWLQQLAADDHDGLAPEAVMHKVASMVGPRDTYGVDTGNVSEWAVRGLPMDQEQRFALSGLFAT
ncbi:pyruvate oxidase, partial [Salmonella enterica subsp. enterica serovar Istanbul]|nr:pyruvate oxidase [Salmonella enterica subsp. enterica serovar Istanbul]